jgi:hypothetical protein
MALNRLEVITHEDIDVLAAPWIVPFVATVVAHFHRWQQRGH